jgi:hypothetical protein
MALEMQRGRATRPPARPITFAELAKGSWLRAAAPGGGVFRRDPASSAALAECGRSRDVDVPHLAAAGQCSQESTGHRRDRRPQRRCHHRSPTVRRGDTSEVRPASGEHRDRLAAEQQKANHLTFSAGAASTLAKFLYRRPLSACPAGNRALLPRSRLANDDVASRFFRETH